MAPICGLCDKEIDDVNFHLEGKCQKKVVDIRDTRWKDYGTEKCAHRCHYGLSVGRLIYEHPQHCSVCDGSIVIKLPLYAPADPTHAPGTIEEYSRIIAAAIVADTQRNGPILQAIRNAINVLIERDCLSRHGRGIR